MASVPQQRAATRDQARHTCHAGFVITVDSSIPTVAPCEKHRPVQWLRWKAGAYRTDLAVAS